MGVFLHTRQSSFLAVNFELCTCLIVWLGIRFQDADPLSSQCGRHHSTDPPVLLWQGWWYAHGKSFVYDLFLFVWKLLVSSSYPWHPELCDNVNSVQFSSFQSLSRVRLFATPWISARQASLSITDSWSSLRLTSIESVIPSSHLILCHPLLLLPPIPPSIRVFSNESTLHMRWPKYWTFSFSWN